VKHDAPRTNLHVEKAHGACEKKEARQPRRALQEQAMPVRALA
jgi:hypothetical protein